MKKLLVGMTVLLLTSNVAMAQTPLRLPEESLVLLATEPSQTISVENAPKEIREAFARAGITPDRGEIAIYGDPRAGKEQSHILDDVLKSASAAANLSLDFCVICWGKICLGCFEINWGQ